MPRATRALGVMACALAMLAGCNASDFAGPADASVVTPVDVRLANAVVGSTIPSSIRLTVTQANGSPAANARVRWTASDNGSVSSHETITGTDGIAAVQWTLGGTSGQQTLTASVSGLDPVVFGVTATADRPARIVLANSNVSLALLGDTVRVEARAEDRYGNPASAPVSYSVESGSSAVELLATGAFIARDRGLARIVVAADTARGVMTVQVDPAAPRPMRVIGDTIRPGVPFAIEGDSFALSASSVTVDVNGVPAVVLNSSRTRIDALIPLDAVACQATAPAQVRITIASARGEVIAPFRVATRLNLNKGQSASLLDMQSGRCAELVAPQSGSQARFMVAVINTSQAATTTSSFELRGIGAGAMAGRVAVNLDASALQAAAPTGAVPAALLAFEKSQSAHGVHLEKQRQVFQFGGAPQAAWRARLAARSGVASSVIPRSEGDIVTVRALYSSCTTSREVQARVVYAGTRGVILEDIAAPRAGTMDAEYRAIGQEFDAVQYPLLAESIGDPLAMNEVMGGDGRVTMLFTRYVNDSVPGIAGYVTACNFYPRTTFAASNEDEIFYARVANAQESPSEWRRSMRSTVMHEAKHIASFAERLSRGHPFEESWLEESTARIAEELYSRKFAGGGSWKGNTGYQTSVQCELYQCDDRPLMMWKHFATLHAFQRNVDELTPIGSAATGDFTFYSSGWSLVRWAADHYALNEGQWFKELVRGGPLTGLASLALSTGRPAGEMLSDWALASAVDGVEGFTPHRTQLSLPSWNTADVMRGLSQTYPGSFVSSPLRIRNYSFGQFTLPVVQLRAFSTSYFSFAGSESGSQVIELRGLGGSTAPGNLRLAVVRVE
jgi:hypothetical protein